MSRPSAVNQLPVSLLVTCGVLSASGMVMLAAGVVAMTQPTLLPALAKPSISWPLIGVGAMLDTGAVTLLLGALRSKRRAP
jgi:hypothetical protein